MKRSAPGPIAAALFATVCSACSGEPDLERSFAAVRVDEPGAPASDPRFDPGEIVESWLSPAGGVRIHFSRNGRNAVPPADGDGSGTPDYVEMAGRTYDEVRALYHGALAVREPVGDGLLGGVSDGGDDRFDVYLVDFAGRGDGAFRREACVAGSPSVCTGFMLQENDFAGYGYPSLAYASRVLASHEYFHAVQAAYDADQDTIFSEATAVWATERFDPSLADFEAFVGAYLSRPDRPLNVVTGGVVDSKSYGTAIFFQFLSESFGEQVVRELLEEVADGAHGVADPVWFDRLDPLLSRAHGTTFAEAFTRFVTWNLYTGVRRNSAKSYAGADRYPLVATETVLLPHMATAPRFFPASARYFSASPGGRGEVAAALIGAELDGLVLLLAAVRGNRVSDPVRIADVALGQETIDVSGANEVIAIVVNTAQSGSSRRPNFCFGSTAEVAACKSGGAPGPVDAGVGSADSGQGSADAGPDAGVGGSVPSGSGSDDGAGCNAGSRGDGAQAAFLAGIGLICARRRRTRSG